MLHSRASLPSSAALRYAPKGDCFSRAKSFRCQLVKPTLGEREATQERRAAEERRVLRLPGLWRPLFVGRVLGDGGGPTFCFVLLPLLLGDGLLVSCNRGEWGAVSSASAISAVVEFLGKCCNSHCRISRERWLSLS